MIKVTIICDDYHVADRLHEIGSLVENTDILDEVYDGEKTIIAVDEYDALIEKVDYD